ncbi:MAG: hypothetical protein K0U84_13400 [Actinomycetia bacterium]|nr:hypothetical protein [Actinomycetes bacterium]
MNREERNLLSFSTGDPLLSEEQLPTSFAENFTAARRLMLNEFRTDSEKRNESEALREQFQILRNLSDNPAFSPMRAGRLGDMPLDDSQRWDVYDRLTDHVEDLRKQNPDAGIKTAKELREEINERLRVEREASERTQARAGASGTAGMFAGTMAGVITDPVNAVSMTVGLPKALAQSSLTLSRILQTAGFGAAIAGGTEAAIQPFVYQYKKKIDSPYTVGDAALNVMAAAAGGGVFMGGAAVIPPAARAGGRGLADLYRKAVKRGKVKPTPDAEAAAKVLEEFAPVVEEAPLRETPAADQAHLRALDTATEQQAQSQPVDVTEVVTGHERPTPPAAELKAIDPTEIDIDAERFQFKAGVDTEGVSDRLRGVKRWEPELAGVSIVWEDRAGKFWIVDGHQRLGLARRLMGEGGEGADDIRLNAILLRERDGVSASEATARAAIKNIAEGTGSAVDAARVFRTFDAGIEARMPELPPNSQLVRDARDLAKLGDEPFRAVINEVIDERYAAIIGRLIDDEAEQSAAISMLAKMEPANKTQAEAMTRDIRAAGFEKSETGDLFGELPAESLVKERAQVLDHAMRQVRQDKRTFKTLLDREADILGHGKNRLDSEANARRLSADQQAMQSLFSDAYTAGPLSDALNEAARAVKGGMKPGKAAKEVLSKLREMAGTAKGEPDIEPTPIRGVVEEDTTPLEMITNPIDPAAPIETKLGQIAALTQENVELIDSLIARIDGAYGTDSKWNIKLDKSIVEKASRPSILAKKPWHGIEHIRDTLRFKTVVDDIRDVPAIFSMLLDEGIGLVKIDTGKLFQPKEWGWRIISFDLRMPNGQLVEWYLPLRELEKQKKAGGHAIFEKWRDKTPDEIAVQHAEFLADVEQSFEGYDKAFSSALKRAGLSRKEAAASWARSENSMLEAARNSRSSSGMITADSRAGAQVPSVRNKVTPSPSDSQTRSNPSSSISANIDASDTSIPKSDRPALDLQQQTPADLEAENLAASLRAKQRAIEAQHYAADQQVDSFTLTGSDLEADELAARGQMSMLEDDQIMAEARRVIDEEGDLVIPELVDDGAGGVELRATSAREALEEIEAEDSALAGVIKCLEGGPNADVR